MTVHMFRCYIGQGKMSTTDLETRINDWVESNGEWEADSVEHTLRQRNTEIDGSGTDYYAIDVRFLPNQSKANLLQKFTDKLENKVAWYRVGYHACTHREGDGSSGLCDWDDSAEWIAKGVSVPTGVPTFDAG